MDHHGRRERSHARPPIAAGAVRHNLDRQVFRPVANTPNGEVGGDTRFYYRQDGDLVSAEYRGGGVVEGRLLAKVLIDGRLDMRYARVNHEGGFMPGRCVSTPDVLPDGRLKLKEEWQWLTGDPSRGYLEVEETRSASTI